jgi:predicted DsbA family dithiol-disulfide isomerase
MVSKKVKRRGKKRSHAEVKKTHHKVHDKPEVDVVKEEKNVSSKIDKFLAAFLVLAVLVALFLFVENNIIKSGQQQTPATLAPGATVPPARAPTQPPRPGSPKLEFYIMSMCPHGYRVMDAIAPVLKDMGDRVDFVVNYIATYDEATGSFRSLAGQAEVDEDKRQLCAMKYYPDNYKYMDYIVCRNKNIRSTDWMPCATGAGLDAQKIKSCSEGAEGTQLLIESSQASQAARASGSPTIILNGQRYAGGRSSVDFTRALCDQMVDKPVACANLPEPLEFEVIILNDKRCRECVTSNFESSLKNLFPGISFKRVDYMTDEGKALYESTKVQYLPAMLFDEKVNEEQNYGNIERFLSPAGEYRSLALGSRFNPTAEICDNGIDDTGNGLIDCDDPTCAETIICREEIPKNLKVFAMSMCPFGVQGLDAMKEVLGALKDITFDIHYIADYNEETGEFSSLNRQPEVDENIRQLCAMKHYPENYKYMDYIWCRNKNIRSPDWMPCATEAGLDAEKIKACSEGEEGKQLLIEDIKIAQALGIGASPTWLANNKHQFSGVAAEAIKTGICSRNPGMTGCDVTLSGSAEAPAGAC